MADDLAPDPPTQFTGIEQARSLGYSDTQIADHIASVAGLDITEARKVGYSDKQIISYLAPPPSQPAPEPPPEKPSSWPAPVRAYAQTYVGLHGEAVTAGGRIIESAGTGVRGAAENAQEFVRHRLSTIDQIDQTGKMPTVDGQPDYDADFARLYLGASDAGKAAMRKHVDAQVKALPSIDGGVADKVASSLEAAGEKVADVGHDISKWAERAIPLTPAEKESFGVKATEMATRLARYIAIGVATGGTILPIMGVAGVDAFGQSYDEAIAKGASKETAAKSAFARSIVQGGAMAVPVHKAMEFSSIIPNAFTGEFMRTAIKAVESAGTLLTFSEVAKIADNVVAKNTFDPERDPLQGVETAKVAQNVATNLTGGKADWSNVNAKDLGATLMVGGLLGAVGARGARPRPTPADVRKAPTLDAAIDTANAAVQGEPADVKAIADQARPAGDEAAPNKYLGLNKGEIIQNEDDGTYHYRTGEGETEQTAPLKTFNPFAPREEGAEPAISPELAARQRDVFERMGMRVVYFDDPGRKMPFDGAVGPDNTIFLASDPVRNVNQVFAHELTHALESTTLPDGTRLVDEFHQQIADRLTNAGWRHAAETFGRSAPDRANFPATEAGQSDHASAIINHLITEMGAEAGGEAPKFATFMPKVIEQIEARYGTDAANGILQKLITGIRQAMTNLREIFVGTRGPEETQSQVWFNNLGDVHDTLAKMWAIRLGTEAERNAAIAEGPRVRPIEGTAAIAGNAQPIGEGAPQTSGVRFSPRTSEKDVGLWKDRRFWSGAFDTRDGEILETHPYRRAEQNDFHHSMYFSPRSIEAMREGHAAFFWINDGKIQTDWREGKAAQQIIDRIQQQIEIRPPEATRFSPRDGGEDTFFSALTRGVENLKVNKATPGQWEATIRNMPGVKAEERAWVGVDDWLRAQPKSVTKDEVLGYLREHEVKLTEVAKGGNVPAAAIDNIREWLRKEYGSPTNDAELSDHELAAAQKGDAEAISALEANGVPAELMKPIYDNIGQGATKFGQYSLPGGTNYRELLLTLPEKGAAEKIAVARQRNDLLKRQEVIQDEFDALYKQPDSAALAERRAALSREKDANYKEIVRLDALADVRDTTNFKGSHWDEPNVLAHIRMDDRTGPNGERVLHVAEIQSDWHQKGRKSGYQSDLESQRTLVRELGKKRADIMSSQEERQQAARDHEEAIAHLLNMSAAVPDAPFKTSWPELAMKRVLRYAAEHGYDRVSWDTGDTNADRYDLSKQVSEITYTGDNRLIVTDKGKATIFDKEVAPEGLADVIGKEAADRLLAQKPHRYSGDIDNETRHLRGEGLRMGGEGMRAFYDKQLPIIANKIGKRFGAKVEDATVDAGAAEKPNWTTAETNTQQGSGATAVHSLPVTPEMRASVMRGQTLFSPRDTGGEERLLEAAPVPFRETRKEHALTRQTETPEFKRWFGDSKVVDEKTGEPKVVYHGTTADISEFKAPAFFTEQPEESAFYSIHRHTKEGGSTYPVYLSINNPLDASTRDGSERLINIAERAGVDLKTDIHDTTTAWHFHSDEIARVYGDGNNVNDLLYLPKVREQMKREGYDGLKAWDAGGMDFETPIWIPLDSSQIKSAIGNRGTFDAANPDIRFSPRPSFGDITPEQKKALENVGLIEAPPKTWRERLNEAKQDAGKKMLREMLDPYIGLKDINPAGYMAVRIANSVGGAISGFMEHATLRFNGAAYDFKDRNGGVINNLIKPLGTESGRFIAWVAGNRAERLKAEDRENLFGDTDIAAIKSLNQGQLDFDYTMRDGKITRSREAMYMDSLAKMDVFNKNVMDLAVESGLLKRADVTALWSNPFYVPFYRVAEATGDRGFVGPSVAAGFVKQNAFKKLTGGTEKLNADLWENAFGNWAHLIDASIRNKAGRENLEFAAQKGVDAATPITEQQFKHLSDKQAKAETVWIMADGQKQYYHVEDPFLFKAISALNMGEKHGAVYNLAKGAANLLRVGVTSSPVFAVRNIIRDNEQAIAVSPLGFNVAKTLRDGFAAHDLGGALDNVVRAIQLRDAKPLEITNDALSNLIGGGLMRIGALDEAGISAAPRKLSRILNTPESLDKFWGAVSTTAMAYRKLMEKGEDVTRQALYQQLRANGMAHDAATFASRDLMDFTLHGASPYVRAITGLVPFQNAWMQGIYKVGRAAANSDSNVFAAVGGKVAWQMTKRVTTVWGAMALASLALDAIYADDPDYKNRTDYDRNSNWWFKVGDTEVRIPMGFEIAAAARLATVTAEVFFDKEMTGSRWQNNVESILLTNMNLNPTPQILKPIYQLATNTGGTGGPIEPRGMESLRPEDRYTINNTLAARGISGVMNAAQRAVFGDSSKSLSPIQLDFLAQAYGGWLTTTLLGAADTAVRSVSSEPERPAGDIVSAVTQNMISNTPTSQRSGYYINTLYDQAQGVEAAYASYLDKVKIGRAAEAKEFFEANKDLIAKHGLVSSVTRSEGELNRVIRLVTNNPAMSAEQKRIQIMALQSAKNRLAESAMGVH